MLWIISLHWYQPISEGGEYQSVDLAFLMLVNRGPMIFCQGRTEFLFIFLL